MRRNPNSKSSTPRRLGSPEEMSLRHLFFINRLPFWVRFVKFNPKSFILAKNSIKSCHSHTLKFMVRASLEVDPTVLESLRYSFCLRCLNQFIIIHQISFGLNICVYLYYEYSYTNKNKPIASEVAFGEPVFFIVDERKRHIL